MPTIEKRGSGYRITVSAGYDMQGKQIKKRMTWTPLPNMTEKQIQKELERQKPPLRFADAGRRRGLLPLFWQKLALLPKGLCPVGHPCNRKEQPHETTILKTDPSCQYAAGSGNDPDLYAPQCLCRQRGRRAGCPQDHPLRLLPVKQQIP